MSKISGKVKWFSNRKGYGFIIPTSDNKPTDEVIFVHQTSIYSDGDFRTLVNGAEVEFDVEKEESGKLKAVNVTAPGGGSLKPPPKRERKPHPPKEDEKGAEKDTMQKESAPEKKPANGRNQKETKPREPPFHEVISDEAKAKIAAKGIELGKKMTVDVAFGEARIKLGQGGYTSMANASGLIGEGSFTCDEQGNVTFTWARCLMYADGKWTSGGLDKLLQKFSLTDEGVGPVGADETAEKLWGADKEDPKDALAENGFKMRRVVLSRPPGVRRIGWRGRPKSDKKAESAS